MLWNVIKEGLFLPKELNKAYKEIIKALQDNQEFDLWKKRSNNNSRLRK